MTRTTFSHEGTDFLGTADLPDRRRHHSHARTHTPASAQATIMAWRRKAWDESGKNFDGTTFVFRANDPAKRQPEKRTTDTIAATTLMAKKDREKARSTT